MYYVFVRSRHSSYIWKKNNLSDCTLGSDISSPEWRLICLRRGKTKPRKQKLDWKHGLINYIDTQGKMLSHLKYWPVKGLCGRCLINKNVQHNVINRISLGLREVFARLFEYILTLQFTQRLLLFPSLFCGESIPGAKCDDCMKKDVLNPVRFGLVWKCEFQHASFRLPVEGIYWKSPIVAFYRLPPSFPLVCIGGGAGYTERRKTIRDLKKEMWIKG